MHVLYSNTNANKGDEAMTPIETMAKAAWEKQHGKRIWEMRVTPYYKAKFCEYMRHALLALARIDIDSLRGQKAFEAGEKMRLDKDNSFTTKALTAFQDICNAIIEENLNMAKISEIPRAIDKIGHQIFLCTAENHPEVEIPCDPDFTNDLRSEVYLELLREGLIDGHAH